MLNILAIEEKKKILTEYRLRLAVVSVFAVGSLVLASLVLLAPSYLLAVSKHNSTQNELVVLEEKYSQGGHEKEVSVQIRDLNNKILILLGDSTNTRLSPPQIILNIIKTKGDAIKIQGFTYDTIADQERIILVGTARDRDSLAAFIETLKNDQAYTNVTLPISSYVKSTNIEFSIVLERGTSAKAKETINENK